MYGTAGTPGLHLFSFDLSHGLCLSCTQLEPFTKYNNSDSISVLYPIADQVFGMLALTFFSQYSEFNSFSACPGI